jgi:hypothetical protein
MFHRQKNGDLPAILPIDHVNQKLIALNYQGLVARGEALPKFNDTGFRVYSQTDEDGKLLFIFSLVGTTHKTCVDIAFDSPHGANTTNLLVNHGWHGILVEGQETFANTHFFQKHPDTKFFPPEMKQAWVTAENINELLGEWGLSRSIDFLSLDVDGVDYWLWKALEKIEPRVVLVEYQDILGPELSLTVPYRPDFDRSKHHPDFFGASLTAFVRLAKEKGYRLIGTNRLQYNAFFMRNNVGEQFFPEISVGECFTHPKVLAGRAHRYPAVKNLPWQSV